MKKHTDIILAAVLLCAAVLLAACAAPAPAGKDPVRVSAADEVSSQPEAVSISDTALVIGKRLSHTLTASGAEDVSFATSDEQIASVDETGRVTAVGVGECDITARGREGSEAVCHVTVKKVCYLSFDDGPNENTQDILAALKENDAVATFFVVGSKYLPLTKDIRAQGSMVGLHTLSHDYKVCYKTVYSYYRGLDKLSDTVEQYTGERPTLIRYPGGTHNAVSDALLMRRVLSGAHDLGFRPFDWTSSAGDTSLKHAGADFSFEQVKKSCVRDEEIILMHEKKFNVAALRKIIPYLRENGYIFATLDQYPDECYTAKPRYSRQHADLPATSVRVTHADYTLRVGDEFTLTARMTPGSSTDFVRWESADPAIATVTPYGTVTGVSKGTADIRAITSSGQQGVCHLTVKG